MKTLRGNQLTPHVQAEALRAFVHRNTVENPHRAVGGRKLSPITDEEWLRITDFYVTKSGELDGRRKHCLTNHYEIPAWKDVIHAPDPYILPTQQKAS